MFIGPCIIVIVEEWRTNLIWLAIIFHFLCAQHVSDICASACKTNTTQNQPHQISNTQRTENKTTNVVIQQHSRKLLMMEILMSETCWAHKKWNKIASDIKLLLHSSTISGKVYWTNRQKNFTKTWRLPSATMWCHVVWQKCADLQKVEHLHELLSNWSKTIYEGSHCVLISGTTASIAWKDRGYTVFTRVIHALF